MGSYMTFKNFGDTAQQRGINGGKSSGNDPLVRQRSIYSMTFDEFQNILGGSGKDFGSMNMEELLKSIWTAEEAGISYTGGPDVTGSGGNLHRQGSLILPQTLSQKTIDEVWRDVLKETFGAKDENVNGGLSLGPREPTLGTMTLEYFLARTGVVREDVQPSGISTSDGFFTVSPVSNCKNSSSNIGFQQPSQSHGALGNQLMEPKNVVFNSLNMRIKMNGARSQQLQHAPPQLQTLFPQETAIAFAPSTSVGSKPQLSSPAANVPLLGMPNALSKTMAESVSIIQGGMSNGSTVTQGSPGNNLYLDSNAKSNGDSSSLSPSPYNFSEGRGGPRSSSSLEKVAERRRTRMIKNRESAARSRARKQAYILELETEVAKLRKLNKELRIKQEELENMQNNQNQILVTANKHCSGKRRCLRRTLSGPW